MDTDALVDGYAAFLDERTRHPGPLRVQLCDPDPALQLAGLFAALGAPDPLEVFVTPARGPAAELQKVEAVVDADFFWTRADLVSCGRRRAAREPAAEAATRVMIATGGTTGGVRFAAHTRATLEAAVRGLQSWFGGGPIDSVCLLPLHHVSGLMQAVRAYLTDGVLTLWDWARAAAGDLPSLDDRARQVSLVPTQLARLLDAPGGEAWLREFRWIFLGGAAAWPALLDRARAAGLRLAPCYGMTETAAQVAALRPEAFLAGAGGVGAALPHARVEVVDDSGAVLPAGIPGRIRVHAASVFHGYHPPGESACGEVFLTQDRGVVDASGALTVLGRLDALINTGGEKVDPSEVEAAIRALGAADVAVVGVPDERWGQIVVAVVAGCPLDDGALHVRLRESLVAPKVPKRIVRVGTLPRGAAGKPDRAALLALVGA